MVGMTQLLGLRMGALALAAMPAAPSVAAAQDSGVILVGGLNVSKLSLPFPGDQNLIGPSPKVRSCLRVRAPE